MLTNPFATPVRKERNTTFAALYCVQEEGGNLICEVCTEEQADYLVLALNNFDECVEALTWGLDALLGMPESVRAGAGDAAIKQIRALIARIDAEEPEDCPKGCECKICEEERQERDNERYWPPDRGM